MRHGKHLQDFRKFLRSSYFLGLKRNASSHLCSAPKASQDWTNAFVSQDDTVEGNSNETGPLSNLNIAIKDNICTKQYKTTCSSAFLQEFSSPYDATVVELLRSSGARIVGKTNCDEFGMGSFNVHSVHGPVINPYSHKTGSEPPSENERRSAGGSSGGSAAAVASGACHAALGTDTGGSIRLPASYCGVTGLKPSYGLISRWGVVSYADSLDCVGILARGVKDINPIFKTLSVYDSKDPTSAHDDVRKKAADITSTSFPLERSLDGLVIGIPQEYFPEELNQSSIAPLRKLVTELRSAGAKVVSVTLPSTPYALSAYYVIASAEASSNLARYSGIHYGLRIETPEGADKKKVSNVYSHTRSKGFGHEVQKRILLGTYALTADAFDNYFLQAQRVRNLVKDDFNRVFKSPNPLTSSQGEVDPHHKVDVLLHPSAVGIAPLLSEVAQMNALEAYVQDVLTVPASLAGLPALSVPIGTNKDGWPLGASIVGQWGQDEFVLRVGEFIEKLVDFKASN